MKQQCKLSTHRVKQVIGLITSLPLPHSALLTENLRLLFYTQTHWWKGRSPLYGPEGVPHSRRQPLSVNGILCPKRRIHVTGPTRTLTQLLNDCIRQNRGGTQRASNHVPCRYITQLGCSKPETLQWTNSYEEYTSRLPLQQPLPLHSTLVAFRQNGDGTTYRINQQAPGSLSGG
jgi:hypothetical protein